MQIKKFLSFIGALVIISVFIGLPVVMLATTTTKNSGAPATTEPSDILTNSGLPESSVTTTLQNVGQWLFYFLIALGGIFIVIAAFQFLTAGGNPDSVTRARNTLTYALVGVALGVLAKGLVLLIVKMMGAKYGS